MLPAVYDETIADIEAAAYLLRAKGSTLKFKGFLAVYEETPDEKQETKPKDESAADDTAPEEAAAQLPPLKEGDRLTLKKLDTDQHFTQPPPRFSEASLVKELEENGIGRPPPTRPSSAPSKRATTWRSARPSSTPPSSASS
jgi:DNA topoisomerase-1